MVGAGGLTIPGILSCKVLHTGTRWRVLIPSTLHTLTALALAGCCSISPVLARVCPCYSAQTCVAACCDSGQLLASLPRAERAGCGHFVTESVGFKSEIGGHHNEGQPWNCRCDQAFASQLFPARVSESRRLVLRVAQPMKMRVAWCSPLTQTDQVAVEESVSQRLSHQRKLTSLGVWRL